jgi:hypothetical protein
MEANENACRRKERNRPTVIPLYPGRSQKGMNSFNLFAMLRQKSLTVYAQSRKLPSANKLIIV